MEDIDPLFLFLSFPLPKRRAHTHTHARTQKNTFHSNLTADWLDKKEKKKKRSRESYRQPAFVQIAVWSFFFFFYFLFHFWKGAERNSWRATIKSSLRPCNRKMILTDDALQPFVFCFSSFSLMKYIRKTESPSSAKKKNKHSTKLFTTKENRVSAYPLWNSSKLFLVVLLLLFFHTSKENENLFL